MKTKQKTNSLKEDSAQIAQNLEVLDIIDKEYTSSSEILISIHDDARDFILSKEMSAKIMPQIRKLIQDSTDKKLKRLKQTSK